MPDLDQLFKQQAQDDSRLPVAVSAVIAEDATLGVEIHVTIPSFDRNQLFGPAKWMPRGASIPAKGDAALVIFDEGGDPWIAVWWP